MDLNEYQLEATKTAVYPNEGNGGVVYTALGLAGEAGEVANKVKKIIRDYDGKCPEGLRHAILEEAGDCLWYVALLAHELGISLQGVANMNLEKLSKRVENNTLRGSGDAR